MQGQEKSPRTSRKKTTAKEENAIEFLMGQHREVEALFDEIESAGDKAIKGKEKLLAKIAAKLTAHTKIEESIFYPEAREADEDLVLEALEEHDNVKNMLRKLQKIDPDDETFDAKITVLKELVRHHVKEEEESLFPKCRKAFDDEELRELGKKLEQKFDAIEKAH